MLMLDNRIVLLFICLTTVCLPISAMKVIIKEIKNTLPYPVFINGTTLIKTDTSSESLTLDLKSKKLGHYIGYVIFTTAKTEILNDTLTTDTLLAILSFSRIIKPGAINPFYGIKKPDKIKVKVALTSKHTYANPIIREWNRSYTTTPTQEDYVIAMCLKQENTELIERDPAQTNAIPYGLIGELSPSTMEVTATANV